MRIELTADTIKHVEELMKERRLRISDMPNAYKDILRRVKRDGKTRAYHTTIFEMARILGIDVDELVEINYDKLTELDELEEQHEKLLEEGTAKAELVSKFIGRNWL